MVAVKIHEDLVPGDGGLAGLAIEGFRLPEIALLHIGLVGINQNFNLIIDAVLEDVLNVVVIVFRQLHGGNANLPGFSVPVGYEIIRLILPPIIKIIVILDSIFTKCLLERLALNRRGAQQQKNQ